MARADAAALAGLRLVPGVEVAESALELWLRGQPAEVSFAARLLALPAMGRYERLPPDRLRRLDERIPSRQLPSLSWQPLSTWLRAELPAAALPGNEPAVVELRLVRSAGEREPELLLTGLAEFQRFVEQAAWVRLERWRFAADASGRVLVRGTPLPPLPGKRFALNEGVAVPAGFGWSPAVSAGVVARRLGASDEALVLWNEDGTLSRLHREQFVPVTRSAVAATQRMWSGLGLA